MLDDSAAETTSARAPAASPGTTHRYTALLVCLLALMIVVPLFDKYSFGPMLTDLGGLIVMLAAVYAASHRRHHIWIASILGATALLIDGLWFAGAGELGAMLAAGALLWALFLGYVSVVILRDVLTARRVSVDIIRGALCGYLMLGLTCGAIYSMFETLQPGSFAASAPHPSFASFNLTRPAHAYLTFMYYSFVTLTTIGYGDITPVSAAARGLSVLEAIIGQFYIAVLVARLVSLQIIHSATDKHD